MIFQGYQFGEPLALLLLLIIPLMIYQYRKGRQNLSLKVPKRIHVKTPFYLRVLAHFGFICRILAVLLCIVAMARPQYGREKRSERMKVWISF